ncbi:Short-chain dehydrogenase TIC 32, chloroplastic [Turnera subulata]|uniref:Short-chain dehydrogenase TIC 32, chloroplastic n=1 Tax=Turnera subulata TaxID=218843 RepID=A0A9Q0J844_9ROSI|nr:Short-chain dehydrogenase TIC 32, chloroplastic [Turnera subulata]
MSKTGKHSSGHFLLTNLLLETMKTTARESNREGRIVNLSSSAHRYPYPGGIRFDKLNDESGYGSIAAYGQSKLGAVLHANELSRRLKEDAVNITANSLHPGGIHTNLFRYHGVLRGFANIVGRFTFKTVPQFDHLHSTKYVINVFKMLVGCCNYMLCGIASASAGGQRRIL